MGKLDQQEEDKVADNTVNLFNKITYYLDLIILIACCFTMLSMQGKVNEIWNCEATEI